MIRKLFRIRDKSTSQVTTTTVDNSAYQAIGGEPVVRRLAERFYDIMESAPEAKELLALHPQPLHRIRQRFYEFLTGWLGGPSLYEDKYGHPRLRARHLPFKIDSRMRDQWMFCMSRAIDQEIGSPLLRQQLYRAFASLADHMRNQAED
jgi:hemoglobin